MVFYLNFLFLFLRVVCIRHCAVCIAEQWTEHWTAIAHSVRIVFSVSLLFTYIPYCRCCSFVHSLLLLFMPVISLCRAKQQSRTEYFNARAVATMRSMCVCVYVCARCSNICSAVGVETVELGSSGISFSTNAHRKSDSSRFCANMRHGSTDVQSRFILKHT